jgi:hypothetical protein
MKSRTAIFSASFAARTNLPISQGCVFVVSHRIGHIGSKVECVQGLGFAYNFSASQQCG